MPRKKKQRSPEYTLRVVREFDDRVRLTTQVFVVETLKEFTSFKYEILLDATVEDRTIGLRILGLRTTNLSMPGVGPATGRREFTDLQGAYEVHVIKLDGEINQFHLTVRPSTFTLKGLSPNPFVVAATTPVHSQGI